MFSAKLPYVLSTFSLVFLVLHAVAGQNCNPESLAECQKPLTQFADKKDFIFATDSSQLKKVCLELNNILSCVDGFMDRCLPNEASRGPITKLFSGLRTFINDLCDENSELFKEYLKHAPCMSKAEEKTNACAAQSKSALGKQKQQQQGDGTDVVEALCCTTKRLLQCTTDVYNQQCGEEAARLGRRSLMMIVGPTIEEMCLDENGNFKCSGAIRFQPAAVLFALAAILWAWRNAFW